MTDNKTLYYNNTVAGTSSAGVPLNGDAGLYVRGGWLHIGHYTDTAGELQSIYTKFEKSYN